MKRRRQPSRTEDRPAAARIPAIPVPALLALAALCLLWACRGAPLGTPVADDYSFLARLRFQHPLDPFDSMGATFYWRPVSRQLYFSLIGPWLLRAPAAAAAVHVALLVVIAAVLYRCMRRVFPAWLSAAVAAFPLLSEPARVLVTWPSGGQHLLAMLGCALALHEALFGRIVTAVLAAAFALLSHEVAAFSLVLLPFVAWFRTRRLRVTLKWCAVVVLLVMAWAAAYQVALRHGVTLPVERGKAAAGAFSSVWLRGGIAQLNLEALSSDTRWVFLAGYAVLGALALGMATRRGATRRLRPTWPILVGSAVWFLAGSAPLVFVLPDWNGWRGSLASMGLGVFLTVLLGSVQNWLAWALVGLRALALLITPPALPTVGDLPPATASDMSFLRLVRLQRVVGSTRRVLLDRYPRLPPGALLRYWHMPRLSIVGFQGSLAPRVWYGDSTISWEAFGGRERGLGSPADAVVEYYHSHRSRPARVVELRAIRLAARGDRALREGRLQQADSLYSAALQAQVPASVPLATTILRAQVVIAYQLKDDARAGSLNRAVANLTGETASYYEMLALLALRRGDRRGATEALRRCLDLNPRHEGGRAIARMLAQGGTVPDTTR